MIWLVLPLGLVGALLLFSSLWALCELVADRWTVRRIRRSIRKDPECYQDAATTARIETLRKIQQASHAGDPYARYVTHGEVPKER